MATKILHIDNATVYETTKFVRNKLPFEVNRAGLEGWTLKDFVVDFVGDEELWRTTFIMENY